MMKKSEVAVCGLSLAALLFFVNPPALAQSALLQINAGGPAVSPFVADEDFSGGATIDHANTINTSKVTNPAPAAVYQIGARGRRPRQGRAPHTPTRLAASRQGPATWCACTSAKRISRRPVPRMFDVSINGTQVLTNFDIEKTAGGQNIANIQQFTEPANSSGQFVILFTSVTNNALISGIEIDSTASCSTPTAPSGLTATAASVEPD